ncbi:unnamed protein product [Blepharisma stoltei]|uniref:Uncharacterized protein n=1 Tax=Blepharisma stoltei TaxID=1481888 RepID=A0AAU9IQQ0_9CILI|nr:unnamed protein product [Blepharisma stoltei]
MKRKRNVKITFIKRFVSSVLAEYFFARCLLNRNLVLICLLVLKIFVAILSKAYLSNLLALSFNYSPSSALDWAI